MNSRSKANKNVAVLAFAMDCIRDAAFLVDEKANFHYVNAEACRVLRYTRNELLSMTVANIDPDFQLNRWPSHWAELKTHRTLIFESRHRTKDGIIFPVELSANYFEHEGESYTLGLARDITKRKKAEEALREGEEQYRTFFEFSTVGCGQADPVGGRLLRVNDRFCEITGYSREEMLSVTVRDLTHPDDREADWKQFSRMIRGDITEYSNEKRYIRKDRKVVWVNVAARVIRDADGKPLHTVGVIVDITERRAMEDALRKSHAELELRVQERTFELAKSHEQLRSLASHYKRP